MPPHIDPPQVAVLAEHPRALAAQPRRLGFERAGVAVVAHHAASVHVLVWAGAHFWMVCLWAVCFFVCFFGGGGGI